MPDRPQPDLRRLPVVAIIFDLDGTLIDSAPDIAGALNLLLAEQGRAPLATSAIRAMIGDGSAELVRRAFVATGAALPEDRLGKIVERYIDIYARHPVTPGCVYPGVRETLKALAAAGIRMGLCTNKPARVVTGLLPALNLAHCFGVVCGGDTLTTRKPDPAPLLWALDRLGLPAIEAPARAVMVGDGRNDVLAARAAGVPVVAVSYGYSRVPAAELGADLVINHFSQLPAALKRLLLPVSPAEGRR
jgi:phosphoglycolate phosphatase